ncbi:MAG: arylesterase [Pikeienuella sp.]
MDAAVMNGRLQRYGAGGMLRKAVIGLVTMMTAISVVPQSIAAAEPIKIVALGDSLTQGFGLPLKDGFVPQLERWLNENGADVSLVNAGVSGDTTAGGLARIEWTLAGGGDALIVALGGNDLLRGIDPASSRMNLDGILEKARAAGLPTLLVGMKAPTNFGAEFKADFDAMYPKLAEAHGAIFDPFFLEGMIERPELFQADRVHPNAEGVAVMVERIGPVVLELIAAVE